MAPMKLQVVPVEPEVTHNATEAMLAVLTEAAVEAEAEADPKRGQELVEPEMGTSA